MNVKKINDLLYSVMIISNFLRRNGEYASFETEIRRIITKFKLVNIYSIIRQHILAFSFKGMHSNLKTNFKMARYILDCEWTPTEGLPELPYAVKAPIKKDKNNILRGELFSLLLLFVSI